MFQINVVEGLHIFVKLGMFGIKHQDPVHLFVLVPLAEMTDLVPHEIQFFARVRVHEEIHGAGLRPFHIIFAIHFLQYRGFSVNDLIVGEGHEIMLVIKVHHGEGEFMVSAAPEKGAALEVFQSVMHPSHIPFVIISKTAVFHRSGNVREAGGVFSYQENAGIQAFQPAVHCFDKIKRRAVDAAFFVAHPVDDAADGVHAQTVKVIFLQPVVRGGLKKAGYLAAVVQEVRTAPFADADVAVGVFVK